MHWCQQLPISTMDIWSWNEKNDTLPWTYHMTIIDCQMISIKVYVQVRDTIKQVPNSPESQVKLQHWSITAAIWVRFGFREEKHPNKNWQSSKLMTQGFQHGTHWTMINHKKHPSSSGWSFHPANCSAMRTGTKKNSSTCSSLYDSWRGLTSWQASSHFSAWPSGREHLQLKATWFLSQNPSVPEKKNLESIRCVSDCVSVCRCVWECASFSRQTSRKFFHAVCLVRGCLVQGVSQPGLYSILNLQRTKTNFSNDHRNQLMPLCQMSKIPLGQCETCFPWRFELQTS